MQSFLKSKKTTFKTSNGIGMLEESLQSEFEQLCTYSNVFFDKIFRKSARKASFVYFNDIVYLLSSVYC